MSKIEEVFECLYDAVILKEVDSQEEISSGGIIVPDLGKEKTIHAEVIAVGPGKYTISGVRIPNTLVPGQFVLLPQVGFTKLQHDGEEFLIGPENNVSCIYKPKK